MKFHELCECFDKLEKTSSKLEMVDILADTLGRATADEIGKISFLTIGKIYPDFMGIELMLAETMAVKALAMATGKNEKTVNAILEKIGDIGKTAKQILEKKTQSTLLAFTSNKTDYQPEVLEIWSLLEKIARTTGEGSSGKKIRLLSGSLSQLTPLEAKFLLRLVSGQMRLGVATQLLLEALSLSKTGTRENKKDLENAYNRTANIGYVAEKLFSAGLEEVQKIDVSMFVPVKVMLAQRVSSAEELLEKFEGQCALEYKYDGLRAQIHYNNEKIKIYSRRPEDITHQFPDVHEYVQEAAKSHEFIVEGEIVAYDEKNNKILPFQQVSQRKRKHDIDQKIKEIPVRVYLFDVIYANNRSTLEIPYLERRDILEKIIKETKNIKYSHHRVVQNTDEIDAFFHQALQDSCEGLMGKAIGADSFYQAGARGWNWVKYKADYVAKLSDSFDLVIIGAEYGKGKRAGKYGTFLLGSYNQDEDLFQTFTKVATGFSDEDLVWFYETLKQIEIEKPKYYDSKIDSGIWFEPKIVIEVSGAEITLSQLHTCAKGHLENPKTGLALRFPRFTGRRRDDKIPEECTTVSEIHTIYLNQKNR